MTLRDEKAFELQQKKQHEEWEATCVHCGACCGAIDGDPCENLRFNNDKSYCVEYENRFEEHKTKSGLVFRCVPIRTILSQSWRGDHHCAYKKQSKLNYIKELTNECSCHRSI